MKIKLFIIPVIIILFLRSFESFCQNEANTDSLKKELFNANDTLKVNIHNKLFRIYYYMNIELAKSHVDTALRISQSTNYKLGFAKSLNNIGVYYENLGSLNLALDNYKKSLKIHKKQDYKRGIAACLNNIGNIHYKQKKYDEAIKYYQQALKLKKNQKDKFAIKQSMFNIGAIYYHENSFDKAIEFFRQCLDIENELNDSLGYGRTLHILGNTYLRKDDFDKAIEYYELSLDIALKIDDKENVVENYDKIGITYLIKGDYENAIKCIDSSLTIAQDIGFVEYIKIASLHLSEVFYELAQFEKAYEYYRLYSQFKEKLSSERHKIAELEQIYETEKLKMEFKHKQKLQIIIVSCIFILLIFIAVFVYSRFRQKMISEQQKKRFKAVIEAQEKERKRIAMDLHDDVGQEMAIIKMYISELEDIYNFKKKEEKTKIEYALKLIDNACEDIRNISHNLMPSALVRLGLVSAIKDIVRKINISKQINVEFKIEGIKNRLDETVEITIYRIIQEAVNNIIKHSEAKRAGIYINKTNNHLNLKINDNGKGFDASIIDKMEGIGWKNIYSRVALLNGTISVCSETGKGTEINIEVIL